MRFFVNWMQNVRIPLDLLPAITAARPNVYLVLNFPYPVLLRSWTNYNFCHFIIKNPSPANMNARSGIPSAGQVPAPVAKGGSHQPWQFGLLLCRLQKLFII